MIQLLVRIEEHPVLNQTMDGLFLILDTSWCSEAPENAHTHQLMISRELEWTVYTELQLTRKLMFFLL